GVDRQKIRFDLDPLCRQAALDEFAARELRKSEEGVDMALPRSKTAMHRKHARDAEAQHPAVAIAFVRDAGPGEGLAQAFLARLPLAEQQGVGAEKAVIVQRLHDR